MNKTKRNITIAAVLLCVCAAIYLNWSYNKQSSDYSAMADAALAEQKSGEETVTTDAEDFVSDYFAEARLTRQQSRDEALQLLEAAAAAETASQETIDGAMNSIAAMASYSMQETQIENLVLAKDFDECLAFISAQGVTLAVPAPAEGLTAEQVAKITDTIVAETDFAATQIKIVEIKAPAKETPSTSPSASPAVSPTASPTETSGSVTTE